MEILLQVLFEVVFQVVGEFVFDLIGRGASRSLRTSTGRWIAATMVSCGVSFTAGLLWGAHLSDRGFEGVPTTIVVSGLLAAGFLTAAFFAWRRQDRVVRSRPSSRLARALIESTTAQGLAALGIASIALGYGVSVGLSG